MKVTEKLAVLIPHFNQRSELEQTIRSITFAGELIVIIVDDGSNESNRIDQEWVEALSLIVPIYVIKMSENSGITVALNTGLRTIFDTVDCRYIARLDCGDYNVPERFDEQYQFMEQHPDVALCGTWAAVVTENLDSVYIIKPPASPEKIKRKMQSGNCFVHPSVMMRTEIAREIGFYPEGFPAAEDYAYFFKFVNRYKTANIPTVLLYKTRNAASISYRKRTTQLMSRFKIILRNFSFHPESFWGIVKTIAFLVIPTRVVERVKEKFSA